MARFKKAKVQIKGVRPLLFHAFSIDTISLERKERTGVAGNDPEEWKRSVLKLPTGQLYLESTYMFGCLREAAKYTKSGKSSMQSKVSSTLQILDDKILLDRYLPDEKEMTTDPTQAVYLDVRSVKNPSTRGRNVRYRVAVSPGWKLSCEFLFDCTVVDTKIMETVIRDAGALVGLADGRSIGYGRFEVTSIQFSEAKL
jgi:hypothetical protein